MRLQLIKATNSITYECVASKSTRSVTPDLECLPYSQSGTQFDHRHAHLLAQQQDHGLHHEGKSAASPSPRHRGLQDPVFLATGAGTRALSSVRCCQNSRCLLHRVVNGQNSPHCGQADWLPGSKSSQSFNSRPLTSISLLTTFHPLPKPSALLKRTLASIAQNLPSRSGEHQLSLSWPKALIRVPPNACRGERCRAWGRTAPIKSVP